MAVVDELENAVDRGVGIGEIDLGHDGGEPLVAARVAREHGSEQLRRNLGQISGGGGRDKGETGDFHAAEQ